MNRTLVLIRHAEAANPRGVGDHDRPLTERGRHQAKRLAQLLDGEISFDSLYVSTAQRAQQTAQELADVLPVSQMHHRHDLYLPTVSAIHELSYECDNEQCVGVVIHEPGVSQAGAYYAHSPEAIEWGVDVATALILTWQGEWSDLSGGCADLQIVCGSE